MSHRCAAEGCRAAVPDGNLMCLPHWQALPTPLRRAVWRTWLHFCASADSSRPDALRIYSAARRVTIAAVREREIKRELRA